MANLVQYWVCGFAKKKPVLTKPKSPMGTGFAGLRGLRYPQGRFKSLTCFAPRPCAPNKFLRFQN